MADFNQFNQFANMFGEQFERQVEAKRREAEENRRITEEKRAAEDAAIFGGVFGGFFLVVFLIICICCCVPACYFSSESRQRRRQLEGGQLPPMGQPGGFGQFGGQGQSMHPSRPSNSSTNLRRIRTTHRLLGHPVGQDQESHLLTQYNNRHRLSNLLTLVLSSTLDANQTKKGLTSITQWLPKNIPGIFSDQLIMSDGQDGFVNS